MSAKDMFRKLRNWLEENKRWHDEHRRAWSGVAEPSPDGFSSYQRQTESAIYELFAARGVNIESREVTRTVDDAENFVVLKTLDPSMTIWIYRAQVDVEAPAKELRLEEWDAKTPDEHRARVLSFLESQMYRRGSRRTP